MAGAYSFYISFTRCVLVTNVAWPDKQACIARSAPSKCELACKLFAIEVVVLEVPLQRLPASVRSTSHLDHFLAFERAAPP